MKNILVQAKRLNDRLWSERERRFRVDLAWDRGYHWRRWADGRLVNL
jgi:hypothetical protein